MLTLHNLSVFYEETRAVHAINLNVSAGECVVLTGESGSGKSSIINAINGLGARYDNARIEGTIALDGDELTQKQIYEIAMLVSSVFQNPKTHFFNVDTTQELLFFLENTGVSKKDMQERLQELLSLFPIAHLLNRNIFELSGGEKQILCLASSYIAGCKLILLDEPTSNLDHTYIEILANMLRRLKEQGITLLIAEHRLYYLREILDRLIHIEKGEIKHCYTQSEFIRLSTDELHALGLRSNVDEALSLPELPPYTIENCPTLRIDNLKLSFEKQCNLHVSNLAFHTNYIYGIVGKNGCGKSSFIKSLIGVMKQSKETVFYRDKQCNKRKRISLSSLVMQDVNSQLFSESVEHELTLTQKNISEVSLDSILEQLNIREFKNVHPMSLSGGQKQRVAIATSIVDGAALMYFDEPTSGMDYKNMLAISHCIQSLKSQKRIIFIVSHDVEFLNITCDYILNIERFSTRQLQ
ncbi:ABC transporter ATP-binding protein [Amygdalobacter indicium]|uniref:ABC transporter ATP-binding protein n=1 Tax=Amygdalobacter indicium TaxID=3029272 RepID=A0ABY8C626_9FIRM|nr:ABC transporter ATP-binding protein [Amygdalobacter indicium]WEG36052.1 ABC transporter ATP-binding protein [Amygdalobacter indicium]